MKTLTAITLLLAATALQAQVCRSLPGGTRCNGGGPCNGGTGTCAVLPTNACGCILNGEQIPPFDNQWEWFDNVTYAPYLAVEGIAGGPEPCCGNDFNPAAANLLKSNGSSVALTFPTSDTQGYAGYLWRGNLPGAPVVMHEGDTISAQILFVQPQGTTWLATPGDGNVCPNGQAFFHLMVSSADLSTPEGQLSTTQLTGRWFSSQGVTLQTGVLNLSWTLTGTNSTGVESSGLNSDGTTNEDFINTISQVRTAAITFGCGEFFGHGVQAQIPAGAAAPTATVLNWTVTPAQ